MSPGPILRAAEQRFGDGVIFDAFKKAEHALGVAALARVRLILRAGDRARRLAVLPGDEQFGISLLEEQAARGVDDLFPFGQKRRHPQRIVRIDPPWEGEKRPPLKARLDGTDLNHGRAPADRPDPFWSGALPTRARFPCNSRVRADREWQTGSPGLSARPGSARRSGGFR